MAETKVVITANTNQAESAMTTLGQSVDGLSKKFSGLSGVATSLTGVLSITAFAGMIKGAIDSADQLSKLSQKTGTSVEALAGLKFAADQNGTSLESVANAGKKLSTSLVGNSEVFAKFGITAKDSTGAMVQLADIFANMPDGVEKTALAVKLMGKNGEEMIPFLNQGSSALQLLIDKGKIYNPITAENALMAQQFNDNLSELNSVAGMLGISLATKLLPGLTDISAAMLEAAKDGGILKSVWIGLGGLGAALFTNEFAGISVLKKELDGLESYRKTLHGSTNEIDIKINNLKNRIEALQSADKPDPVSVKPKDDGKGKKLAEALGLGAPASGGKNPLDEIHRQEAAALLSYQKLAVGQQQLSEVEKTLWEIKNGAYIKFSEQKKMELLALAKVADFRKSDELAAKDAAKQALEDAKILENIIKMQNAAKEESAKIIDHINTAASEEIAQMRFETSLLGLNTDEIQRRTEARRIDLALEKELLAIRGNEKFKDRGNNDAINRDYEATVATAKKSAEETKKITDAEIVARNKAMRSWEFGYKESMRKYIDEISNAATITENMMTKSFKGMEDALVQFIKTGKLDFGSLVDSIITDIIRIQVQQSIMAPIAKMMSSSGGLGEMMMSAVASTIGGGFGGSRAVGGNVEAGKIYRVNENRTEYFRPNVGGTVLPLSPNNSAQPAARQIQPMMINNTFVLPTNIDYATQAQVAASAGNSIQIALRRNG